MYRLLLPSIVMMFALTQGATAQETTPAEPVPQPEPLVDAQRPERQAQHDAWRRTVQALRAKRTDPRAQLIAAWAMFHQFDIDVYWLVESDFAGALNKYEEELRQWHGDLVTLAEREPVGRLARYELNCLLDDIAANRLQARYDEANAAGGEPLRKWFAEYAEFQTQRAQALQDRGKLVLELYRSGEVDALRPAVALLERQIAERLLSDHLAEQAAKFGKADGDSVAQRQALLAKQQEEWKQLSNILSEVKGNAALAALVGQYCALQQQTLDLLLLRAASMEGSEQQPSSGSGREAELVKQLFERYRELQRKSAAAFFEKQIGIEEFARLHDLRMYTSLWHDRHLLVADVVAEGTEAAAQWQKAEESLQREQPGTIAAMVATAKRLEAEITREERKPEAGEEAAPDSQVPPPAATGTPTEAKR